jgi:hypothetical protein
MACCAAKNFFPDAQEAPVQRIRAPDETVAGAIAMVGPAAYAGSQASIAGISRKRS